MCISVIGRSSVGVYRTCQNAKRKHHAREFSLLFHQCMFIWLFVCCLLCGLSFLATRHNQVYCQMYFSCSFLFQTGLFCWLLFRGGVCIDSHSCHFHQSSSWLSYAHVCVYMYTVCVYMYTVEIARRADVYRKSLMLNREPKMRIS